MAKKPCGTWIVTDIPEDRVGSVMAAYRAQDPVGVEKEEQPDGKWKVTAVFPDCPPGQPNSHERSHSASVDFSRSGEAVTSNRPSGRAAGLAT